MKKHMSIIDEIFKFLCSLRLAVLIIVALGAIAAVGTIMESRYDTMTAQKLVYHSFYMYITLGALVVNLIAVMIDRLPWKKRHIGFVLAHTGIVILILASYITQRVGVDGSLSLDMGESSRFTTVNETELIIYKMKDMENSEKIYSQDVDFFSHSPQKKPISIPIENGEILIDDYMPYAKKDFQIVESDKMIDGPALRFQIKNPFANVVDWVVQTGSQPAKFNMGPAQVVLTSQEYKSLGGEAEIVLYPTKSLKELRYELLEKDGKKVKQGYIKLGQEIQTNWMGMTFKAIQFYPKARVEYNYSKMDRPKGVSTSAVHVRFSGKEFWLGMNTALQLYSDNAVYFITYGNKRLNLGFTLTLDHFEVENYQGSRMAKSYKSLVRVSGLEEPVEISMNEPLKHKGYTFYQTSFQEDSMGKPTASIFTVNYDPGRWGKYLGSFLIIFGTILLFYFKHPLTRVSRQGEKP